MRTTKQARREAKQLFRLCLANGVLDEQRARQVVRQIGAARGRRRLGILWHFHRLVRLDVARHTAAVESAAPLPPDLQERVRLGLARVYGPELATSFTDRPALIGGIRIQVGSDLYDGSIRARLAALQARW